MATRMCDPFVITEETADILHEVFKYWKGKTTSELATSYMSQDCLDCRLVEYLQLVTTTSVVSDTCVLITVKY